MDIAQYQGLPHLIKRILNKTNIPRISLGSIYPEGITNKLLDLYARNWPRLARHFHISLQSGCNKTLQRMNRHYIIEQYRDLVHKIHRMIPQVNLTTDVIAGFPGETEADFQESLANIQTIDISRIHVFPYSKRPKTLASKMEAKWGRVPNKIKQQRAKIIRTFSQNKYRAFLKQFLDQELEVLFENQDSQGSYYGYSDNYIKVFQSSASKFKTISNVRIKAVKRNSLIA